MLYPVCFGTKSCGVAAADNCGLSVIANIPNTETARGVCIKALDFDRPHVPSGIYNNVSYRADFEDVPTTDGQMWFKLTAYGPN